MWFGGEDCEALEGEKANLKQLSIRRPSFESLLEANVLLSSTGGAVKSRKTFEETVQSELSHRSGSSSRTASLCLLHRPVSSLLSQPSPLVCLQTAGQTQKSNLPVMPASLLGLGKTSQPSAYCLTGPSLGPLPKGS